MSLKPFPIVGLVKGQQTNVKPAMLPENAWQILENAYTFRERELKREGTALLGRLQREFSSFPATIVLNGSAIGHLITGFSLQTNADIVPGTLSITDATSGLIYSDPAADGVLVTVPPNAGHINYATGEIFISGGAGNTIYGSFDYHPNLPVMGIVQRELAALNVTCLCWPCPDAFGAT